MATFLFFAILGFLVVHVISEPGEILHPVKSLWLGLLIRAGLGKNPVADWAYKITFGCAKCFAGFWCLTYHIIINQQLNVTIIGTTLAIFTGWLLTNLLYVFQKNQ